MKVQVRNGTPIHGQNLCLSCSNSSVRRGHRVSEEQIHCFAFGRELVPFMVAECDSYRNKALEHPGMFYETAWQFIPDVGFVPPDEFRRREQAKNQVSACPANPAS